MESGLNPLARRSRSAGAGRLSGLWLSSVCSRGFWAAAWISSLSRSLPARRAQSVRVCRGCGCAAGGCPEVADCAGRPKVSFLKKASLRPALARDDSLSRSFLASRAQSVRVCRGCGCAAGGCPEVADSAPGSKALFGQGARRWPACPAPGKARGVRSSFFFSMSGALGYFFFCMMGNYEPENLSAGERVDRGAACRVSGCEGVRWRRLFSGGG